MEMTLDNAVDALVEAIKADYLTYTLRGKDELTEINEQMVAEFNAGFEVLPGRKYIKIVSNRSVWGFIVATDTDKKFPKGTILMAAGYNAPARNHSRGNVLDGGYTIQWTGPLYM